MNHFGRVYLKLPAAVFFFSLSLLSFSQTFPSGYKLKIINEQKSESANRVFTYSDILSENILEKEKAILLFFTFKGCTGCKMAANDVLIPYYGEMRKKYAIGIMAIAKLPEGKIKEISVEYAHYPFKVLLDKNDAFFVATTIFVQEKKYAYARPRILLIKEDKTIIKLPLDAIFSKEKLFQFLDKHL